jgi:site-specific DNA-methyltransferase (adenine-specific)
MSWSRTWLAAASSVLDKHGSMFLFYPDELAADIDVFCRHELKLYRRSWIVWYYTFGVCNVDGKNFSRSHTHILYYSKAKTRFTFNDKAIRVPSARELVYNDKRASRNGKVPDNTWALLKPQWEEVLLPDQDTWLHNRVCGTYTEREHHLPNQLPVALLERIILAASDPDDLVVDAFLGSGSTGEAALKHGRRFLGIDVSTNYVKQAKKRLNQVLAGRPSPGPKHLLVEGQGPAPKTSFG